MEKHRQQYIYFVEPIFVGPQDEMSTEFWEEYGPHFHVIVIAHSSSKAKRLVIEGRKAWRDEWKDLKAILMGTANESMQGNSIFYEVYDACL
jgi:hypothetical protein